MNQAQSQMARSQGGGTGLGLTTGKTIQGNTAFGPAGGRAVGTATRTGMGADTGMRPTNTQFSNFRDPSGAPMIGGALQNRPVTARSAQQALGMLQALQAAQRAASGRVGGLLDGEQVTSRPLPRVVPPAAEAPSQFDKAYWGMWWGNPTSRRATLFNPNRPDPFFGSYGPGSAGTISQGPGPYGGGGLGTAGGGYGGGGGRGW